MNIRHRPAVETPEAMTLPGKVFRCSVEVIINGKSPTTCAHHVGLSFPSIAAEFRSPSALYGSLLLWSLSRNTATTYGTDKWMILRATFTPTRARSEPAAGQYVPKRRISRYHVGGLAVNRAPDSKAGSIHLPSAHRSH